MWAAPAIRCLLAVALVSALVPGAAASAVPGATGPRAVDTAGAAEELEAVESHGTADSRAAVGPGAQDRPAADGTATRVRVYANGSARWTVRVRTRLSNDSEVEAYRRFQDRFRNDTARYLEPFRQRIRGTVASAANATDRPMNATDFTASTSIRQLPRRFGVVTYSFTWHGFARPAADGVAAGDAFVGGVLLSSGDTLTLVAPPDHAVARADPAPDRSDGGQLTWQGPRSFADRRPRARFVPGTAGGGAANDGRDGEGSPADGLPWYYPAGGLALLAGAALVAGLAYRRRETGAAGGTVPDAPLTDADRVHEQLAEAGGQLKQQEVAETLDWSASKTSRTLSDMEDEGVVERVRIGRENVVRLIDEE
jgi:hypothetical protein